MPITTIRMLSDEVIVAPIAGVVVEFYNLAGVFQTSGTSDVNGEVTVTLPADFYDVVMFKQGISILPRQPQRIEVLTQIDPNVFEITAHIRLLPESNDPDLCRVSGYVINSSGKPQRGVKLTLGPILELVDVTHRLVDPDHAMTFTSDERGYFEFDLLRNVSFEGFLLGKDDWADQPPGRINIRTPDFPAISIDYLLFPVPESVDFSVSSISVPAGSQDDTTILTVTYTDKNIHQTAPVWGGYNLINSNGDVFDYEVAGDKLIIKGKLAGTATLTAERTLMAGSSWLPEPPFNADVLTVTVT